MPAPARGLRLRLAILTTICACHTRGAVPAPRAEVASPGEPVVATTAAGEAARVEFRMAGTPSTVWNFVNAGAQDSSFRFAWGDYSEGRLAVQSFTQGLFLQIGMQLWGEDSTIVAVSGMRYAGPSDRAGYYLAGQEHWPPILTGDASVARLRHEAVRIRDGAASTRREREEWATRSRKEGGTLSTLGPGPEPNPDSIVRVLSNGKLGYCRAGHVRRDNNLDSLLIVDVIDAPEWCPVSTRDRSSLAGNTWVLRDPRSTPVGDTLSACAFLGGPGRYRFDVIAFYTDRLRCRPDPDDEQQAEPNMVLLRRVE